MSKIHLLTNSYIQRLKQKAKEKSKNSLVQLKIALDQLAIERGFTNWSHLIDVAKFESDSTRDIQFRIRTNSPLYASYEKEVQSGENALDLLQGKYSSLVYEKYTYRQKFGSIARSLGINPSSIKNVIYIHLQAEQETIGLSRQTWDKFGLFPDEYLALWLERNDPFFADSDHGLGYFRLIGIDTTSYNEVTSYLEEVGRKLDLLFGLYPTHIWINGKIDPQSLIPEDDYPDYQLPQPEIPKSVWHRGFYK